MLSGNYRVIKVTVFERLLTSVSQVGYFHLQSSLMADTDGLVKLAEHKIYFEILTDGEDCGVTGVAGIDGQWQ